MLENGLVTYAGFEGRIGGYFWWNLWENSIAMLFMLLLVGELSPVCDVFMEK